MSNDPGAEQHTHVKSPRHALQGSRGGLSGAGCGNTETRWGL